MTLTFPADGKGRLTHPPSFQSTHRAVQAWRQAKIVDRLKEIALDRGFVACAAVVLDLLADLDFKVIP